MLVTGRPVNFGNPGRFTTLPLTQIIACFKRMLRV